MPNEEKTPPPIERLSGLQTRTDRRKALETLTRAFNTLSIEKHCASSLWQGKLFNPEHTRIAVVGRRVVSAVVMAPRTIRFGTVSVPAMTIGPVGTHDKHRKCGYGAATMNDVSKYLADNGYLAAYLQGIPDYYHRFGFYPFAPVWSGVKFQREEARKAMDDGRFVKMTRKHLDAVREIYDTVSAGRICAAKRDAALWEWLIGPGAKTWLFMSPRVILNAEGEVCGYVTSYNKTAFDMREVVIRPDVASFKAALGAFVKEAKSLEVKELSMTLPPDDAFAIFLRHHVAAEYVHRTNPIGGSLMKIVNFKALMHSLEPLFVSRWESAHSKLPHIRFILETDTLGSVGIAVGENVEPPDANDIRMRVPARWLPGLLTGWHIPQDISGLEGVVIPEELKPYLEVLFPRRNPFVYQADNY